MNIYCLGGVDLLNDGDLIRLLPLSEKNRIDKITDKRKRTVSAAAFLLFLYAARREYGITAFDVMRTDKGKPYVRGNPFYFSYSHTRDSTVCAVYDSPVGIDAEKPRPFKEAVAKRVCTPDELYALNSPGSENEKAIQFCKMWVQKEAYSKMTGNGFSEGFDSIDTLSGAKTDVIFNKTPGEYIGISTDFESRDFEIIEADINAVLQY